jgi:hypothetical protein
VSGADEFYALARDFGKAPAKVASALFDAYRGAGEGFRDDWRHNVQATGGTHLPHLPAAITSEMKFAAFGSIEFETGPEAGMRQGRLGRGDEFGSVNQPPHLNGLRAIPLAEKRLDRLADAAVAYTLP